MADAPQPRAPGYKHINAPVVVIVCRTYLQPARDSVQSGLQRPVAEGSVSVVVKVAKLISLLVESEG